MQQEETNRGTRAPRFRRTNTRPFRLTARDYDIIRALARHKVLQSTHFDTLFAPADPQRLRQRLYFLYHHSYVARPKEQVLSMLERKGSQSLIYTLAPRGARLIAELDEVLVRPKAAEKLGQLTHSLEVSDVLVSIEAACRNSERYEFVPFAEILSRAPAVTQGARTVDEWKVEVRHTGALQTLHLRPDAIFAIRSRERAAAGKPALKWYFLEADRSSMPVVRPRLHQSSILRKLLSYAATFDAGLHQERFGMSNMRALFVAKSSERAAHMIDAYQEHVAERASPRIFLFADRGRLFADGTTVLEALWLDGAGEEHTLLT